MRSSRPRFSHAPCIFIAWLSVMGCGNGDGVWRGRCAAPGDAGVVDAGGYWEDWLGCLSAPSGAVPAAVSCHNCYSNDPHASPAVNLARTRGRIRTAIERGADIIELDVKEQGGTWRVDHEDDGLLHGPRLAEVLADDRFCEASQMLFIEVKENAAGEGAMAELLRVLDGSGCLVGERPWVLRAFRGRADSLAAGARMLAEPEFAGLSQRVRVHWLYSRQAQERGEFADDVESGAIAMVDGVEFQFEGPEVEARLAQARALGLGTGVWTLPVRGTEALCGRFAGLSDIMTVDGRADHCKRGIESAPAPASDGARPR